MGAIEGTKPAEPVETEEKADDIETKINVAVRAHLKREMKGVTEQLSKSLGEQIAKGMETLKAQPSPPAEEGKSKNEKDDPKLKLALEEIEKLKRANQEERDRTRSLEDKARKEMGRGALKAALEAKGIKGRRADAAIALMETEGALRFPEDGESVLSVKRSRAKGASPELLEFSIADGVEDWCKTADAAEFLPAPAAPGPGQRNAPRPAAQQQNGTNGVRKAGTRYEEPAVTEQEAARRTYEQLTNQGVNLDALLND
jgi:hypothetical protein